MGLRKGKCYTRLTRAYTRKSKYKSKAFIKGFAPNKIVKYDLGNLKDEFNSEFSLASKQAIQIRHNALESARIVIVRRLNENIGPKNFHFKLRLYPHQVLREKKILAGAGADRLSSGMSQAFGKPMGTAAVVKKGQKVFTVYTDKKYEKAARDALRAAFPRLPCQAEII
ncbi:MAG: 50S ribosomal protein L16 [Candidatus Nanoarchaeia archaeon]|nr:50S ribosomal protein L16 [Candidatus Nanoarchaeia archaeon]